MTVKENKVFEDFCKENGIEGEAKELYCKAFILGTEEGYEECYDDHLLDEFGFNR